ncbi:hypothetical protein KCU98_g4871, partial [Aureobasidium melanogenum]
MVSSSSSAIPAVSSSATTGYLINVGVGSTSLGVIQTAGGGNLVDVGAGSIVSTQISASAANPITTVVGSAMGSSGIGTTVVLSTPTTVSSLSASATISGSSAQLQSSSSSQSASSSPMTAASLTTSGSILSSSIISISSSIANTQLAGIGNSILTTSQTSSTTSSVASALGHLVIKYSSRHGQHSEFVHCYHLVLDRKFSRGSWCYKCAFYTSGVLRYVRLSKRFDRSGAIKQPVNSSHFIDVKQHAIEHCLSHERYSGDAEHLNQLERFICCDSISSNGLNISQQPYIYFDPVKQFIKSGDFIFDIEHTLKHVLNANPLASTGSIAQTTPVSSSVGSSTTSLAQASTGVSSQASLSSSIVVVASSTSTSQPVVVLTTTISTAAIGVATNVLPVASQGTSTSSSAGSSTVPSVVSTSASSVTPTSVAPSTIASSASSFASSSSASSSAGSSVIASSVVTTSSTINSNTGTVASSTLVSSSASSSTPVTSILATTSNLAFVKPEYLGLFFRCYILVIERASVIYDFNKLQRRSVRFFVKSSHLDLQFDNSVVKYPSSDQHISSVVDGLEYPKHFEACIYCFGNHELLGGISRHVKGGHDHFSSLNIKCYFHYYQL